MTETEFAAKSTAILDYIEDAFDSVEFDVDIDRKGDGVVEIEFASGSKIVINTQAPMRQIWLAAKSGGFHFRGETGDWLDTRSGEPLMTVLARVASEQSGSRISFD